ncbi:MAG: hypothetical protein GXX96_36890 [Planctomycetaceae bacterium]|nr:hypothetical protein [Planctomycetaceae bacterium]
MCGKKVKYLSDINDNGKFIGVGIGKDDGLEYGFSGNIESYTVDEPSAIDIWTCGVSAGIRYVWKIGSRRLKGM